MVRFRYVYALTDRLYHHRYYCVVLQAFRFGRNKNILFCLALVIPGSYGIPFISLLKVWKQERRLGIYWKDRTDYDRPEWERDWYLTCDRGGFILYHRNFIRRIVGRQVETEIAEHARGKVYYVMYEDIDGKTHKLKFSSDSLASEFQYWFKKQVDENE